MWWHKPRVPALGGMARGTRSLRSPVAAQNTQGQTGLQDILSKKQTEERADEETQPACPGTQSNAGIHTHRLSAQTNKSIQKVLLQVLKHKLPSFIKKVQTIYLNPDNQYEGRRTAVGQL